jgi:pyridoxine kinase
MLRVLCLSSHTVFGPVGNAASVPALQEYGHEVMALPTVVLSNHPGLGKPAGQRTEAPLMADMLSALEQIGAFEGLAGVLTGYFANAAQVVTAAKQIQTLQSLNQHLHVVVDPVLGDHDTLYVPVDVAEAIRDHLLPLASTLTPNWFELRWLSGCEDAIEAVSKLSCRETLVTSVPEDADHLATELYVADRTFRHVMPKLNAVPHGTGDFLAGAYLARRFGSSPKQAFESAMERLSRAIAQSVGKPVLCVAPPKP